MKRLTPELLASYDIRLQAAKNKDYGNSFDETCQTFGPVAICIRLHDKINHLRRLFNNNANVKDESMFDTWLDTVNYALMGEAWLATSGNDNTADTFVKLVHQLRDSYQNKLFANDVQTAIYACHMLNVEAHDKIVSKIDDYEYCELSSVMDCLHKLATEAFYQCVQYDESMLDKRYVV